MQKQKPYAWCVGPNTMNELRQTNDCEYSRPRRLNKLKEISYWGDRRYSEGNSWKNKRITQYREHERGKKHELEFSNKCWRQEWNLEEYFKEHDIPYRLEDIKESRVREHVTYTERVPTHIVPLFCYVWRYVPGYDGSTHYKRVIRHQIGFEQKYFDKPLDKPKVEYYNVSVTVGSRFIWWSNKDVGIEHILKRVHW